MARIEDIPEPTRSAVAGLECITVEQQPFVAGPPLAQRRVAMTTSAALIARGDAPFPFGSAEVRLLSASLPAAEILMGHVSINCDRAGWQRDINTFYPLDRLRDWPRPASSAAWRKSITR